MASSNTEMEVIMARPKKTVTQEVTVDEVEKVEVAPPVVAPPPKRKTRLEIEQEAGRSALSKSK
jgi:hypothetical protein